MRDEKSILPVSHMMHGQYGIDGVVLSMPAIVGANGVESDIPIELNGEEALKLKESADALKSILDGLSCKYHALNINFVILNLYKIL